MNAMNQFRAITHSFHTSIRAFTTGALALGLGLFAVAGTSHAGVLVWTNTAGGFWNDPLSWAPNIVPGPADDGTFNAAATYTVTITNDTVANSIDNVNAANTTQTLTLDLTGHALSLLKGGTGQPTVWTIGDAGSSTAIVYLVSSTGVGQLYCTNGSPRFTMGRSGIGTLYVSDTRVFVFGSTIQANGGTGKGKLVLSGANTYWTNSSSFSVGNSAAATGCSLVISNSASMTVQSTFGVGGAGSSSQSLLLDTGGKLFTASAGTVTIGNSAGSNNVAVVQNGASWDNGNRLLSIGASAGGNSLTIGTTATVVNVSTLAIAAGNTLSLSGGLLQVSFAVTNNSGTITGFGAIAGNAVVASGGRLNPGYGTTVGTLTLSNNLTLLTGSTTTLKLDKGQTPSNDVLNVVGTLTEAGTLTINNVGAALVGGDTFQVLAFGSKSGDFTTTNLPPLTGTLIWDTSQLGSSGIISVVLPATITDPAPQAVLTNTDVTISTVVTGVPTPVLQWQKDGGSLVDGATGNGSTISGSASSSLVISNAQVADSGQYCLIASNTAGAVTNCMTLEVTVDTAAPLIGGLHNQNVISPNSATFSAMVAGIPAPTLQWQDNGSDIANETNTTLVIPGVTFALDGHSYCIIASNSVGTATNCASLFVVVPPLIQTQPQDVTVTNSGSATFTVVSTNGVPAPTFQWYFNNIPIANATNTSYTIANATPANAGSYKAVVANVVGSATSSNATLTVTSTMSAGLTPTNGATAVCYDTPLYMAFDRVPVATGTGTIKIFNVTNSVTPVDTINMASGSPQPRTIGFENFNTFPIIITASNAAIYPHLGVLSSNQTYYVTVDQGVFVDSVGALFAGISDTNAWRFSTKQTGPVNPNNVTVAFDGSGDFCTVQGAVDSLPSGNTTYTLVTIHNGTYTEIVDTRNKNHITFRGQSRAGTIVGYKNNDPQNPGTHFRMAFKVFGTDTAIENMTVVNTTPQGGQQAEALMLESAAVRFILNNAELDSRQDTILANGVPQSQGYFYNSLVQGNFDYIWGGGNLYFTKCEIRTIPGSSTFNLTAARTDFGTLSGYWTGAPNFPTTFASNGMSFVNCRLTRSSGSTVSNITMAGANGATDGLAAFINCSIDVSNNNGYIIPPANVLSNELVWEFGNSNLDGTASVTFGMTFPPLSNGDTRLTAALDPTIWLNGWVPQLAPNILTNPVSVTVTAGVNATFSVAATGIPDPTYQWQIGGSNLVGQTGSTLTVSNARCADAGTYSVIVSNIAGVVTSSNATLTVIGTAPVASFTAGPSTSGTEPLSVTFTDTSTGSPTSLAWDFGDLSSTTTTGGATVVHAYAAGTYTVTLTASNACDISTLVSNNMISVVTAFQAWQLQYFGCTNCSQADANADPDGDGVNNGNEFATGFNPNSAAAYAHIIKVVKSGPDMNITYLGANGDSTWSPGIASRTNVLEFTHGSGSGYNGNYSNNFVSVTGGTTNLSGGFGTGTVVTVTDTGAASATNRYYRIRVIAP